MNKFLLIFLILIVAKPVFSQETQTVDTPSVLIIPFRQDLYFNELSGRLIETSGKTYEQVLNDLRAGINKCLLDSLENSFSLLSSTTQSSFEDVEEIYSIINYQMKDCPVEQTGIQKFINKGKRKPQPVDDGISRGEVVSTTVSNENRFVHAVFDDSRKLISVVGKHDVDYFISVNQLEIKGDYSNPDLVIQKKHEWILRVHASIYSKNGEYLTGNKFDVRLPFQENNLKSISEDYMSECASQMKQAYMKLFVK